MDDSDEIERPDQVIKHPLYIGFEKTALYLGGPFSQAENPLPPTLPPNP
jgi:hypothetical protein